MNSFDVFVIKGFTVYDFQEPYMRNMFTAVPFKPLTNDDIQICPAENRVFPIAISLQKGIKAL